MAAQTAHGRPLPSPPLGNTKHCSACDEIRPLDQFRLIPPRKPGRAFTRHAWCVSCERESARQRAAKRYREDGEFRVKQLANAARQNTRRRQTP
jgi:hypothetical protein